MTHPLKVLLIPYAEPKQSCNPKPKFCSRGKSNSCKNLISPTLSFQLYTAISNHRCRSGNTDSTPKYDEVNEAKAVMTVKLPVMLLKS